jgi:hypothetical protein
MMLNMLLGIAYTSACVLLENLDSLPIFHPCKSLTLTLYDSPACLLTGLSRMTQQLPMPCAWLWAKATSSR